MPIHRWTEVEKLNYFELVAKCTVNNVINWQSVFNNQTQHLKCHTPKECEDIYYKLKKADKLFEQRKQLFSQWSPQQLLILILSANYLSQNFEKIQQIFFQDKTEDEIRQKYNNYIAKQDQQIQILIQNKYLPDQFFKKEQMIEQHMSQFVEKYKTELQKINKKTQILSSGSFNDSFEQKFDDISDISKINEKSFNKLLDNMDANSQDQ
ncbi:Conserved_hypothetical protein [Hexamita inflata]|uniref:Myb-like domain-containing protein n=1 Tax=Hexamita inflata TaxID=28002 RepID=A0AA86TLQ5_9EUKA|nr:Conserved hypothetical protein [Hexamita inflata]